MTAGLAYEVRDGVGHVVFDRPAARNALTLEMFDRLRAVCEGVVPGGDVHALILCGSGGRAFAAGADIAGFRAFRTAEDAHAYEARVEAAFGALERCPAPTLAAVTGACTGGGATLAACCDIRIGDPALRFGVPVARTLGNCLSAANLARLTALLGPSRVKEMLLTARLMEAEEARACGLFAEIVDDPLARAFEIAVRLKAHAPLTMRATKEAMRRNATAARVEDRDLIALCYGSEDFREGVDAFLSKRPPVWKGR